ncbi:NAD(P)/FAD-dependent oxidoreductase [Suttonella sp. R2A3]|uniref:NAD(P)/FAD-dependent oxidoreductase n=1 Tax=Suttonella sp. R2A3 TaxID=2908648 RepID=UPI001F2C4A3F|nr:aminoacetone oxidase family FAD-binding enzyme [Suttonella sp. R2A3]UJF24019.1 NAD(P)/FAD-dependent oxidoreductase [Suttonella sp. R2A3]
MAKRRGTADLCTLMNQQCFDVVIIGGGAAGSFCAIHAAARGLRVAVIEQNSDIGAKIRVSGGGRCNLSNLYIDPSAYLSDNPNFCRSALARYTQWDALAWFDAAGLSYHEKTLGQLFCDQRSRGVIAALRDAMDVHGVVFYDQAPLATLEQLSIGFRITTSHSELMADQVVIACGGPSFAKLGGSDLASRLAKQFALRNIPFRPALVPLTLSEPLTELSGVSTEVVIHCGGAPHFREQLLFTHRGLSGPAVLQISSYWRKGQTITVDFLPSQREILQAAKARQPQQTIAQVLRAHLPNALANYLGQEMSEQPLQHVGNRALAEYDARLHAWPFLPSGSEGMRKAEVCTGGIDTRELDPRSFAVKSVPGLYAIGEAVDVTGWLGGYNFQWAWSSAWCCAQALGKST